jgi:hypothetical protein
MYPNSSKLDIIRNAMATIDGQVVHGDLEIVTELENCAGMPGCNETKMTFRIGRREVDVMLDTDDAAALAEALMFYANAGRRLNERGRRERETAVAAVAGDDIVF